MGSEANHSDPLDMDMEEAWEDSFAAGNYVSDDECWSEDVGCWSLQSYSTLSIMSTPDYSTSFTDYTMALGDMNPICDSDVFEHMVPFMTVTDILCLSGASSNSEPLFDRWMDE